MNHLPNTIQQIIIRVLLYLIIFITVYQASGKRQRHAGDRNDIKHHQQHYNHQELSSNKTWQKHEL